MNPPVVEPGQAIWVGGYLWHNHCNIAGEKVALYVRDRPGPFTYIATRTTQGASGGFGFRVVPKSALDAIVVHSESRGYGRAVSRMVHLPVIAAESRPFVDPCTGLFQPRNTYEPPAGVTLAVVDVQGATSGSWATATAVIRNSSSAEFRVGQRGMFASALSKASGEVLASHHMHREQEIVVAPNEEVRIAVSVLLRTCQDFAPRYRVPFGPAEIVAGMWIDAAPRADLLWVSPPADVNL